jgi:ATP/maltotriose-dependent transcriptional regulator MalT
MKTRISGKEAARVAEDMAKPGPIRVVATSEAQEAPGALVPSPGSELDRKMPPRVHANGALGCALTPREHQIISLVSAGFSNKEIARWLNLTEATVKTHLHNIYQKAHVQTGLLLPHVTGPFVRQMDRAHDLCGCAAAQHREGR